MLLGCTVSVQLPPTIVENPGPSPAGARMPAPRPKIMALVVDTLHGSHSSVTEALKKQQQTVEIVPCRVSPL